jgi:hypothetical protein
MTNPKHQSLTFDRIRLIKELTTLKSSIQSTKVDPMLQFFSKSLRRNIQQLFIDNVGLQRVKSLIERGQKVILMPYHKSFADFTVLFTAQLMEGLPAFYTFGCSEDTPRISNFDNWLSSCGYIRCEMSDKQSL